MNEAWNKKIILESNIENLINEYLEATKASKIQLDLIETSTLACTNYVVKVNVII